MRVEFISSFFYICFKFVLCYVYLAFFVGVFGMYYLSLGVLYQLLWIKFRGWLVTLGVGDWLGGLFAGLLLVVTGLGLGFFFWSGIVGVAATGAFFEPQVCVSTMTGEVVEDVSCSEVVESFVEDSVRFSGLSGGSFVSEQGLLVDISPREPYGLNMATVVLVCVVVVGSGFMISQVCFGRFS